MLYRFFRPKNSLPHRKLGNQTIHLCYRLKDSISRQDQIELAEDLALKSAYFSRRTINKAQQLRAKERYYQWRFLKEQRYLTLRSPGPFWLEQAECQRVVIDSWLFLEGQLGLKVYCCCVMANHVHVVLSYPLEGELDLTPVLGRHKSYTAKAINQVLSRSGRVWADNYFDRDVRQGRFVQTIRYVLNNPVKAGICEHWAAYSGTYLATELIETFG